MPNSSRSLCMQNNEMTEPTIDHRLQLQSTSAQHAPSALINTTNLEITQHLPHITLFAPPNCQKGTEKRKHGFYRSIQQHLPPNATSRICTRAINRSRLD
eukprot:c16214_g1_i1 orf=269-568(+)